MNNVCLVGNLGADPELRYTQAGQAVCTLSVAVNEVFKNGAGEAQKHTNWFRVIAWNVVAEKCAEFLKKGSRVGISGSLRQRSYESEGVKKFVVEIIARSIDFLSFSEEDSKSDSDPDTQMSYSPPVPF